MMQERGVEVDPSAIMRWVHRDAPELEKRVRAYQGYGSTSWRVDETYVKVGGGWKYLFRAVDKHGVLIDFLLSDRRNTRTAHRFLAKALTVMRNWPPVSITPPISSAPTRKLLKSSSVTASYPRTRGTEHRSTGTTSSRQTMGR